MELVKEFAINEETVNYIERLSHEVDGAVYLIASMIESGRDTSGDTFKKYNDEYVKNLASFNIAKEEVQKKFVPQALLDKDASHTRWELVFETKTIKIIYNGTKVTEEEFNSFFN